MTEKIIQIKQRIQAAHDRQKSYADLKRKPMEFQVGDRVILKVSPWKGVVRFGKRGKLNPRYVGPFKVLEKVGSIAYNLELPQELSRVHNKFHFVEEPNEIMEREIKRLKRSWIPLVKVRWNSRRGLEFTWERDDSFKQKYPQLFTNRASSSTTREKGIKREYSVARTPQQNGVAERRNKDPLIMAAHETMFADDSSTKDVNAAGQQVNTASPDVNTGSLKLNVVGPSVSTASPNEEDSTEEEPEVDLGNITNSYIVPTTPNTRIHKDHPIDNVIGEVQSTVQTRRMSKPTSEQGFLSDVYEQKTHDTLNTCLYACFLSQIEPTSIAKALSDSSWVEAMQEELLQFKLQQVWILVDLPNGKKAIGTKWVFRNKKDERGIVIRNKARIEAIRLFLAYASFMGFLVYQMDVKSAFLYGTIEEEVYVTQPPGFKDPEHPDKVYMVVKALYGLHQAPRAWYETLASYLLSNGFKRGKIYQTLFIKKQKGDILLVQVYVDDIIFGSTNKELCTGFEKLMIDKFQISSMGELTFFLGLQVQQKEDGIFISQDKYVAEILKKFNYSDVKSASTPVDLEKPLVKDGDADDIDVHLYRSMIGSLMYLTASRPDIMFAVCACARFQVTPKTSHLLAVKRIFRYLKGKPTLGLWYSRDSPFELVAYTDSDYAGATLDRKSTTGGCQFLGNRLISWQCKKQTVVATSTTEAEYVAAASCCGQVLWIQNQLLDYGYNFMNTVINIDNNNLLTKGFDAGRFQYLVSIKKRFRDTKVPSVWCPPKKGCDEAVHKELGDIMERAATTSSSLEAEQESAAELLTTVRHHLVLLVQVNAAQGKDGCSIPSNDSLLSVRIECNNRIDGFVVPTYKNRDLDLEKAKCCSSIRRLLVKEEGPKDKDSLGAQEDASKQGRSFEDIDKDAKVSLVDETQGRYEREVSTGVKDSVALTILVTTAGEGVTATKIDEITTTSASTTAIDEITLTQTLIEIKAAKPKSVTTAATTTTTRPKARGVVVQEPSEFRTTTSSLQASHLQRLRQSKAIILIEG
ncbi:putative ribonuclease H-like domain-containing protein [Tanacetum coccineum]|uniref:Ribonuclease H-like domain-containing protein n=1 Tax=Tanacetum coccineum TaxID=301880 RepID=A0ABQ5EXK6_9ASTR